MTSFPVFLIELLLINGINAMIVQVSIWPEDLSVAKDFFVVGPVEVRFKQLCNFVENKERRR